MEKLKMRGNHKNLQAQKYIRAYKLKEDGLPIINNNSNNNNKKGFWLRTYPTGWIKAMYNEIN